MGPIVTNIPLEQEAIRARCFHPSGEFVEFKKEDIGQSIPERFEQIVRLYPDRLAIKTATQSLTYAELNAVSDHLAGAILKQQGDRPGAVGLLFEKGAPLIASMLGVLKAGKFFVLLDPSFPKARTADVLEDSRADLVIFDRQNISLAQEPAGNNRHLLEFESIDCGVPAEDFRLSIPPNELALVVHTSGSTGQPKGVVHTHRNILHDIMLRTNVYRICAHDRLSLLASGTSSAINNTFLALLNGAALLPFDSHKEGPTSLASWLSRESISVCWISSPLFRNFAATLTGNETFRDLRLIRLASDAVYQTDVELYKKYFPPGCLLANGIAPTETGLLATYFIDHKTEIAGDDVPLGYVVDDTEMLLLDDAGKEVGFNTVGEIAVRSAYLALGYWQKPDATKTKFVPDPTCGQDRLYLTGDLGVMRPDGCLVYKGRKDFRVKIRGYGVEIAEVENVLRDYAAIDDAVVVARENESGEARLVAYFTSPSQLGPSVSELRRFLKDKLPDYMIPSAFVMLDAMPLNPNGKIDRRALPDPKNLRPELNTPLVAPRTSKEEKLVKIWAKELRIDQIGVHDNFFDLGGHSLLAMRVISQIRDDLQVELSLSHFFEIPTVAALAGYIERARPPRVGTEALSIQLVSRDGQLLLSFAQQCLWFIDQLEPGCTAYNLFSAAQLTGRLNAMALEQSFNEIIRRHEALRTVFKSVNGQPFQVILPVLTINLPVVDLRDTVSPTEREAEVRRLSTAEAQRPFDLARGPLLRATLLRSTEETYVLLLTVHHIIFDGWSRGVLDQELSVIYEALSSGQPASLPALPIQYADFAQWKRQWLRDKVFEEQLAYWKKQLENVPILQLPSDRPRPAVQTFRGARQSFTLPEDLCEGLKILGRQEGVTLFMTLLAAYLTLLHRYTGQNDIGIGSPISGRNRSELEGLIGFFLNMLVLRTDLSGNPTFRELLSRAREVCLEAYANQDVPFEKLVQELQPQRSLSHNPLFQVTFALQNTPTCPLKLAGVTAQDFDLGSGIASFDLHLFMVEEKTGLGGWLVYNTDLFDASTIARLVRHFQMILEAIVANPEQRLSDFSLLTEGERHQLLVEWNDTYRDYPNEKCIHELFEAQVEKTPDAVAVVFDDQQLTYRELNERANQLAHYLRKLRVGPEVLVGLCLERTPDMVVALVGILKAGGAYLPLDPTYPKERLAFMLQDSRVSVLLAQQSVFENLPKTDAPVVCLDTDWKDISLHSVENPQSEATAANLAYVIYTSGSTGTPKGVEVLHRGIVRLLFGVGYANLDTDQIFLHLAPMSFDASTFEIWGALLHGARCVLFPGAVASPSELGEVLHKYNISTLWLTASLFNAVIDQSPKALSGVRQLLIGGEALSVSHVRKALSLLPETRVINGYGPTESTTFTCCYSIPRQLDASVTSIPIGRPIANTEVYLLDAHLSPVPIGVAGELYISGDGLARGYLNRPELTAEKFIPNPFSTEPGARLYKTGDLARYLPDGYIEFLGRSDYQVKIRGFRIELGEVEAVLGEHPAVRETVVIAREDAPGDKRLVAYVVSSQEPASTTSELRHFLKQKLPEYMVPSAFVLLDILPLTPNGKVDRKALPAPDRSRPEMEDGYVPPCTPVEELLTEIWAEVLKVEKVGIHDNFFDLGGHSLLATQVISRIHESLQVELPLRALFEAPTVAGLAERIEETRPKEQGVETLPMLPVSREKNFPLSFAQQRLWFLDQLEPGSTAYNVRGALRLRGSLDVAALEQSLHEIIRRHEALRTSFSIVEGEPVQVIAPSLGIPLSVVDLTEYPESEREEEARRLARDEARRCFDLTQGPLLRASLIRLGEEDHVLLLTMHHIVSDGWSMGVLHRELSVLYQAFSNAQSSPLPDLSIHYADFAVWQRAWLQGEVLESQLSYWKKQLEGVPAVLSLPTDRPRPAVQSFRGARQSLELSKEVTQGLKALSRKEGVTLFMTLLAAFQTLLYRYTGQDDIVVGSPIANRNRAEIEDLIGFFVNTLVLRTNFTGDPTFKELLGRVREVALGAYAHQDLPFEKLVEELKPERSLSHSPLLQILFNMVSQGDSKLDFFGLTTERFSLSEAQSKFDLTLYVTEQKDEISLNLVYRVDLFSQARMVCFLEQYRYVLEQIVAAPQRPVRSYSLVTAESRPLLPDPTIILDEPPQQLITNTFLSWAKQRPTHPAISQGQQTWTYAELAQCADTLARLIVTSGLARGEVVAVYGQPSFGLVAGTIATFLSGGVLLPVDCALPLQRKQRMIREAKAKRLLYVGAKQLDDAWLEEDFGLGILFVDPQKGCTVDRETGMDLQSLRLPEVDTDDPAYIFFTSGTTGVPKGVLGRHKSLSHFLAWQRQTFAIGPGDRSAQLTALSFDAVLRDIFLPLTSGATLCLPEVNDLASGEILQWLERQQITVLHAVPSLAQSWLAYGVAQVDLRSMRGVFFVGEPLTEALVRQWRAVFPDSTEIVNLYGPTETTLVKCFYRVPADIGPGVQPVGRPIPDTQALVLAGNHQLCGINEPGEIVLRTPFRSLGYVNAPEENQKRFVKNPFRDDPQDLIYFTGDAGCYRPDGSLEILGRLDDQVKIRGVRIEPAEVTATLARHPLVESCVVVGKKNERDETYLAAYAVASGEEKSTTTELRSYLLQQLPAAMVPTVFVFLDSLPLTPNGKIDRKALPEPDQQRSAPEESYIAPRSRIESVVAGIWAEVLKLQRVSVHDNFFALGGHSLLATQIVSRIREALQVDLLLRALFENPTVSSLSDHLEAIQRAGNEHQGTAMDNLDETEEIIL